MTATVNFIYQNGMIPTINNYQTRVTRKATIIDHIVTSFFTDKVFKVATPKTSISDLFPICYLSNDSLPHANKDKNTFI